jgi:hypothetical protein
MSSRPEISGRKVAPGREPGREGPPKRKAAAPARKAASARKAVTPARKAAPAAIPIGAYSIASFCLAHALSQAMYFKMRAAGEGPDAMAAGRRRMVSIESASRWRAQREEAARETKQEKETAEIAS